MISWINGSVIRKGENWLIIDVAGLGYRVFASPSIVLSAKLGEPLALWTHEQQRDDGREFYGFATPDELEFFWKLITVSGVGPKMGLTIVGASNLNAVKKWIDQGNIAALSEIHGVGKKTAQKIVLELKGKLADVDSGGDEAADALVGLGYSRDEARSAVSGIEGATVEERVKEIGTEVMRRISNIWDIRRISVGD
jgi:Holliday junction DNA helicase RuvA